MQKGFTLIEVMLVMVTMVALGFAMMGVRDLFQRNELTAFNTYSNISDSNAILTELTNEVRKARSAENGAFAFESMGDNEIVFYSDVDFDGQTERVRYTLNGNRVEKGVTQPTGNPIVYDTSGEVVKVITENAQNGALPMFYYYNLGWPSDTSNNPLVDSVRISDTQLISIQLVINSQSSNPRDSYSVGTFVQPRILKHNL